MFSRILTKKSTETYSERISRLRQTLDEADAVMIGAGAGLSTSAGLTYSGERFQKNFGDFIQKYGIQDMYSGGFYPFETLEEHWAWWSRHIMVNRYEKAPKPVYEKLFELVKNKDYFVLTTNVDHQFQLAGFDKKRLFYTQGDYGLWQCSKPCCQKTYDNEEIVRRMAADQKNMRVPTDLVPRCPVCGEPMTMNLRCDNTFVQDEGWYEAAHRYEDFMRRHQGMKILFLELGVGGNTPVIIKFVFHDAVRKNKSANYICVNLFQATAPEDIQDRSICISADCGRVIEDLLAMSKNK